MKSQSRTLRFNKIMVGWQNSGPGTRYEVEKAWGVRTSPLDLESSFWSVYLCGSTPPRCDIT